MIPCPGLIPIGYRDPGPFAPDADEKHAMIGTFFNLTPEMHDRMVAAAREVNVPISQFCRTAIGAFLADMEDDRR